MSNASTDHAANFADELAEPRYRCSARSVPRASPQSRSVSSPRSGDRIRPRHEPSRTHVRSMYSVRSMRSVHGPSPRAPESPRGVRSPIAISTAPAMIKRTISTRDTATIAGAPRAPARTSLTPRGSRRAPNDNSGSEGSPTSSMGRAMYARSVTIEIDVLRAPELPGAGPEALASTSALTRWMTLLMSSKMPSRVNQS